MAAFSGAREQRGIGVKRSSLGQWGWLTYLWANPPVCCHSRSSNPSHVERHRVLQKQRRWGGAPSAWVWRHSYGQFMTNLWEGAEDHVQSSWGHLCKGLDGEFFIALLKYRCNLLVVHSPSVVNTADRSLRKTFSVGSWNSSKSHSNLLSSWHFKNSAVCRK